MEQEESLLVSTEILLLEYELEGKTSTGSILFLYTSSPSLIDSPPSYHNMSQSNYSTIIRQLQEQVEALIAQLVGRGLGAVMSMEVARPQVFNGTSSKVSDFVLVFKNEDERSSSRRTDSIDWQIFEKKMCWKNWRQGK